MEDNSSPRKGGTDGQIIHNKKFIFHSRLISIPVFLWPEAGCGLDLPACTAVNTIWEASDLHMSLSEVCPELLSSIYDFPLMTEQIHS